jgi:sulfur carrier protein ThiS
MKVRVNLYGTLGLRIPGYQHSQGLEVELPDGATVKDLLTLLKISGSEGAVVAIEGHIKKTDDKLPGGAQAQVFQTVHGG